MAKDFLLDDDGDLKVVNGDFAIGEAESQHVEHLIYSFKGEWKEYPLLGAEAQRKLKQGNALSKIKKDIRQELEADGYTNVRISIQGETININADRP